MLHDWITFKTTFIFLHFHGLQFHIATFLYLHDSDESNIPTSKLIFICYFRVTFTVTTPTFTRDQAGWASRATRSTSSLRAASARSTRTSTAPSSSAKSTPKLWPSFEPWRFEKAFWDVETRPTSCSATERTSPSWRRTPPETISSRDSTLRQRTTITNRRRRPWRQRRLVWCLAWTSFRWNWRENASKSSERRS